MKKVKVKILEPIAGLGDPKPVTELDRKYERKIAEMNKGRREQLSRTFTEELIASWKLQDRYGEKPLGFPRDFGYKVGDEPMISEDLAQKWEDSGICTILAEPTRKAA